jgi:hypothetical protein
MKQELVAGGLTAARSKEHSSLCNYCSSKQSHTAPLYYQTCSEIFPPISTPMYAETGSRIVWYQLQVSKR